MASLQDDNKGPTPEPATNQVSYEVNPSGWDPYLAEADDSKFENNVSFPRERSALPPIQASTTSAKSLTEETPKCQDAWAAVLFALHLVPMLWLAFGKGLKLVLYDIRYNTNDNSTVNVMDDSIVKLAFGGMLCTVIAGMISFMWLKFILKNARGMIHCMLVSSVVMNLVVCGVAAYIGQWVVVGMCVLFAALTMCYYKMVKNRIPFAATNLAVACTALRHYFGPIFVACLMTGVLLLWQFVWGLALMGSMLPSGGYAIRQEGEVYASDECKTRYDDDKGYSCECRHEDQQISASTFSQGECQTTHVNGFFMFLLLLSFFWGSFIISNIVHCTTAGAVSDWWFNGPRRSPATIASFKRAITTSFGSICLGSLLTAVIKAMHQMAMEMRRSRNNALACVAECLLGMIDGIAQYFNRYAFSYVAIYGTSFMEGGKSVMELFRRKGLTAIINDQLVSNVFALASFCSAMLVGLVGYGYIKVFQVNSDYIPLVVGLGIIIGFTVTSIIMNVVDSATLTIFICFAEYPGALQHFQPALAEELASTWAEAHQHY